MPNDTIYDPKIHLSVDDVAVDNAQQPTILQITIKQSKTDPFRKRVDLFVGRVSSPLCPVAAVTGYLCVRGTSPGPLFRYADGRPLTRPRFAAATRSALSEAGIDSSLYCTHSFLIIRCCSLCLCWLGQGDSSCVGLFMLIISVITVVGIMRMVNVIACSVGLSLCILVVVWHGAQPTGL